MYNSVRCVHNHVTVARIEEVRHIFLKDQIFYEMIDDVQRKSQVGLE